MCLIIHNQNTQFYYVIHKGEGANDVLVVTWSFHHEQEAARWGWNNYH